MVVYISYVYMLQKFMQAIYELSDFSLISLPKDNFCWYLYANICKIFLQIVNLARLSQIQCILAVSWLYFRPLFSFLVFCCACRYLLEHPEYIKQGVNLSQFSFQIPRPLQENYVRKRAPRMTNPLDGSSLGLSRPLEPEEGVYNK